MPLAARNPPWLRYSPHRGCQDEPRLRKEPRPCWHRCCGGQRLLVWLRRAPVGQYNEETGNWRTDSADDVQRSRTNPGIKTSASYFAACRTSNSTEELAGRQDSNPPGGFGVHLWAIRDANIIRATYFTTHRCKTVATFGQASWRSAYLPCRSGRSPWAFPGGDPARWREPLRLWGVRLKILR